jgi:hypothetical protein
MDFKASNIRPNGKTAKSVTGKEGFKTKWHFSWENKLLF